MGAERVLSAGQGRVRHHGRLYETEPHRWQWLFTWSAAASLHGRLSLMDCKLKQRGDEAVLTDLDIEEVGR